jgi:phosphonate transport system substrate-binding protein
MEQKINGKQVRITRREMLRGLGGTAAAFILAACGAASMGQPAPAGSSGSATTTASAAGATAAPAAAANGNLTLGSADTGSFSGAPDLKGKLSLQQLNLAFIPAEDAAKTLTDNKDLIAYLKQVFGVEVTGAVGTSYSAVIEAQRAKKVDLAFYGPFSYILGHEEANAQALIQGETKGGQLATYNSLIITQAESPLSSLADIKGKNFSFVDPASTSGHLVPSYTLLQKAGLKETDYKPIYAGSHPASYQAVVNNKVDAGAIASDTFAKGVAEGSIDDKKVKILDTSFPIPGSPIAVRGDIPQADQDLIVQAFLALNDQGPDSKLLKIALAGLGSGAVKLRKADDHAYDELRKIPAAIGIDIKGLVK